MMVVMFMLVVIIIVIVVMMMLVYLSIFVKLTFDLLNPCGRSGYCIEIEHLGIDKFFERNVAIVALHNLCLWLKGTNDFVESFELLLADFRGFVEQDHVAELNLLDEQILNIIFIKVLAGK